MEVFREYFSLASERTIDSALQIDAQKVSTLSAKDYADQNRLGYTICINCWLVLIRQYSPFAWMFVSKRIAEKGFLATIKSFDEASNALVHGQELSDALARSIARDVDRTKTLPPISGETSIGLDSMATILFLLRFPKRFSPIGADVLLDESIRSFLNTENRTKLLQRREPSRWVIPYVRARVRSLDWDRFVRNWTWDLSHGKFTPGVCFETGASLASKVLLLSHQCPEVLGTMMGTYYAPMCCDQDMVRNDDGTYAQMVRIMGVPKSYKSARIVAPEELQRQMLARDAFDRIETLLPPAINLRDQTQNQKLCELGAATGELGTIDLSSASDCVSASLVRTLFPQQVVQILDRLTALKYITPDKKVRTLQQYSTMGNALTFIIESIVFWAIAQGSKDYVDTICPDLQQELPVSVYGDDIIVPTYCAETCCEWLTELGFIVNETKSFISKDHLYRESCGAEWFHGVDVSTLYWPRKELYGSITKQGIKLSPRITRDSWKGTEHDSTSILVELQHRLYGVSEPAAQYVSSVVLSAHPKMTFSEFGSSYGDLWGPEDTSKQGWPPVSAELYDQWKGKDRPEWLIRPIRYRMSVSTQGKCSPEMERVWDQYVYTEFLKHGPLYTSELDRLLGISTPRQKCSDVAGKPVASWRLTK